MENLHSKWYMPQHQGEQTMAPERKKMNIGNEDIIALNTGPSSTSAQRRLIKSAYHAL